jgi:hypothetical protein
MEASEIRETQLLTATKNLAKRENLLQEYEGEIESIDRRLQTASQDKKTELEALRRSMSGARNRAKQRFLEARAELRALQA